MPRWNSSIHGIVLSAALTLTVLASVPSAEAQDPVSVGSLTPVLAGCDLAGSGVGARTLLREFENLNPSPRGDIPPLSGAALYAVTGIAELSPPWARGAGEVSHARALETTSGGTNRKVFLHSWVAVTSVEFALLATTAALPRDWTGWSHTFIQDGLHSLKRAYTTPPAFDSDRWYHDYLGHPYGGSVYYNAIRSQGGSKTQSFLFSLLLSTQWEYVFEAVAERPSIQDLIVTPISGRILGELINRMTLSMVKDGTNVVEKAAITVLNPMYLIHRGFRSSVPPGESPR